MYISISITQPLLGALINNCYFEGRPCGLTESTGSSLCHPAVKLMRCEVYDCAIYPIGRVYSLYYIDFQQYRRALSQRPFSNVNKVTHDDIAWNLGCGFTRREIRECSLPAVVIIRPHMRQPRRASERSFLSVYANAATEYISSVFGLQTTRRAGEVNLMPNVTTSSSGARTSATARRRVPSY
jgi:hypothetical protein